MVDAGVIADVRLQASERIEYDYTAGDWYFVTIFPVEADPTGRAVAIVQE